jgi:hypothetical protein
VSYPGHPGSGADVAAAGQAPPFPPARPGPSNSTRGSSSSSSSSSDGAASSSSSSSGQAASSSSSSSGSRAGFFVPPPGWHAVPVRVYIANKTEKKYHVGVPYTDGHVRLQFRGGDFQCPCNPKTMGSVKMTTNQANFMGKYASAKLNSSHVNSDSVIPNCSRLGHERSSVDCSCRKSCGALSRPLRNALRKSS